jgi:hypothetical protein
MRLDEEAQKAETQIVGRARRIRDVATLKRILHESLTTFEKALDALPATDREEAFSLYLDKIRKVTFGFHYAILRRSARNQFGRNPSHKTMQSILASHDKNMQEIARLYRFL